LKVAGTGAPDISTPRRRHGAARRQTAHRPRVTKLSERYIGRAAILALVRHQVHIHAPLAGPLAIALGVVLSAGCMLPFATPPVRVTQSFGLATGTLQPTRAARRDRVADVEPVAATRIGVYPLQLVRSLRQRRFDFGVGYVFETFTARQLVGRFDKHGVYGEVSTFPVLAMFDDLVGTRIGTTLTGDVLFSDAGFGVELGGGASLALTIEVFGFAHGGGVQADVDLDDGIASVGGAWGEWSVAMSAYGAYRALDGAAYTQLGIAVSVRLPASAGAVFFFPKSSGGRRRRRDDEDDWRRGTVEVHPPTGNYDRASDRSSDDYDSGDSTPSDGGIGAESGNDDGTVEVNPPPERGTVEVNPPDRATVEVRPP